MEHLEEKEVQGKRGRKKKGNYILFPQLQQAWAREERKALWLKPSSNFHYYMSLNILITD